MITITQFRYNRYYSYS